MFSNTCVKHGLQQAPVVRKLDDQEHSGEVVCFQQGVTISRFIRADEAHGSEMASRCSRQIIEVARCKQYTTYARNWIPEGKAFSDMSDVTDSSVLAHKLKKLLGSRRSDKKQREEDKEHRAKLEDAIEQYRVQIEQLRQRRERDEQDFARQKLETEEAYDKKIAQLREQMKSSAGMSSYNNMLEHASISVLMHVEPLVARGACISVFSHR